MSSQTASSRSIEMTEVENVSVNEESLMWTSTGTSDKASLHELVLVREVKSSTESPPQYLLFLLKEDQDNKESPYQLSILKSKKIPSELRSITLTELPPHLKHGSANEHGITNQVDVIVSVK